MKKKIHERGTVIVRMVNTFAFSSGITFQLFYSHESTSNAYYDAEFFHCSFFALSLDQNGKFSFEFTSHILRPYRRKYGRIDSKGEKIPITYQSPIPATIADTRTKRKSLFAFYRYNYPRLSWPTRLHDVTGVRY